MTRDHERDTVGRFSDRVADYIKYRPTYPVASVRAVLSGLGPPARLVAGDMGAGTGISARLLGNQGVRVVAIEPGEEMRRSAEPHRNVMWMAGRADASGLRQEVLDVLLCAQSFHWFRPADVLPEFARILKPEGRLAIVWNRRNDRDPLTAGYRQAIIDVVGDTPGERMSFDPEDVTRSGLFSAPERTSFPNVQRFDLDGLIGRARSASYVPKSGAASERLLCLLRALHATHADAAGMVTLVYETEVYRSIKL